MKYLSPFAPDISGAVSVFFRLGGVSVILDAGGCTGNSCGFDEPRWFSEKSAVFSAGLRDLDAILGRDRAMLDKTAEVLEQFDANFLAIIGSPVPAVIGTDFRGLVREAERRFRIPAAAVETNGMDLYDRGASGAYLELVRIAAAGEKRSENAADGAGPVAVFGCTPLDLAPGDDSEAVRERLQRKYPDREILIVGDRFEDLKKLPSAEFTIVTAPSGAAAAREMERRWNIPWRAGYPVGEALIGDRNGGASSGNQRGETGRGGSVLIVHQAVFADALGRVIREQEREVSVRTATFFDLPGGRPDGCILLRGEDDFIRLIGENSFDRIYADPLLERACAGCGAEFIPLPHFAVSGSAAPQNFPEARPRRVSGSTARRVSGGTVAQSVRKHGRGEQVR